MGDEVLQHQRMLILMQKQSGLLSEMDDEPLLPPMPIRVWYPERKYYIRTVIFTYVSPCDARIFKNIQKSAHATKNKNNDQSSVT
jgi:hypothetical protein